jgi:hypothetical protein
METLKKFWPLIAIAVIAAVIWFAGKKTTKTA